MTIPPELYGPLSIIMTAIATAITLWATSKWGNGKTKHHDDDEDDDGLNGVEV